MRKLVVVLVLSAGMLVAADKFNADVNNKILELQKERIVVLKEVVELSVALQKSSRLSHGELTQARLQLLNAELEASQSQQERISVCEKIVELWKEAETNSRQGANPGTGVASLNAKAARLKAEVDLERERNRT